MKPRIFISSVSKELRSARQIVANTLLALGYEPIWQDIFDTSGEDIRGMLRNKIESCSAVLQIVGDAYGAEPRAPDEKFGRVSYTQYEALYARSIGKKVYYLIASHDLPRDAEPESIDVPREDSEAAHADAVQRRQLQRDYLASIQSTGHIYYAVQSNPETELAVRRLKDELDRLRRGFRAWMIGVTTCLIMIGVGIVWLGGGLRDLLTSVKDGQKKTEEQIDVSGQRTKIELKQALENAVKELTNPDALAERIRLEIQATAEAKINALPDEQGRGRKIAAIEKERDLAAGRVDDLVKLIQEGLREGASPVFKHAADILQKEGTDEALVYLESRRQATLVDARRHAEQANAAQGRAESENELRNKSLQSLILEAELLESKLQWEPALKLREQIAELAPDWFEARALLGLMQLDLARFQDAEPNLRAAVKLATTANDEANALANLAHLLHTMNRLTEAEPMMRHALAIDEERVEQLSQLSPRSDSELKEVNTNVARDLINLALLLQTTNQLAEAESMMRRALTINEKDYGEKHPRVATILNNLAILLMEKDRFEEAEPLIRRALTIDEEFYGDKHHFVAIRLGSLGHLHEHTKRLEEAERLYKRALKIDELYFGSEHPSISRDINNIASVLNATNHRAEAEPLMRRALAIDEHFFGADHPEVARSLNNLAQLLMATNRLAEAEPLMRRSLAIEEQSHGVDHPKVANRLSNLAQLLGKTQRPSEAELLMRRVVAIHTNFYGAEHSELAEDFNYFVLLLEDANHPAEAEQFKRRGLAIDEQFYGAEHPNVAMDLYDLAHMLAATKRRSQAELLLRRAVIIMHRFEIQSGQSHSYMADVSGGYRILLDSNDRTPSQIAQIVKRTTETQGPLEPIAPEIERLLGSMQSTQNVYDSLDRQYRAAGKPNIWFLPLSEPIAPHLDELLGPLAQTKSN